MFNIVIPMAGAGSRFADAGFKLPKPLIPIFGKPMIQLVVENIRPKLEHKFIFVCQEQHLIEYELQVKLDSIAPGCEIITLGGLSAGAACTVLSATQSINNDDMLLIANSDQFVDSSIDQFLDLLDEGCSGAIMTMIANNPKWSYVAQNEEGAVTEVAEKRVISTEATVGIYAFTRGSDFVRAANTMIDDGLAVNGEYYVAPVYNQLIKEGAYIKTFNIGNDSGLGMHGLGTPEDLKIFTDNPKAKSWVR